MENPRHIPVLVEEVVRLLNPRRGESYFDGTAGYGGHAAAILERVGPRGPAVLVDRDQEAIDHLRHQFGAHADIWHSDFLSAAQKLAEEGRSVDMVLLDLGVSSPQLDQPERGFSFNADGPLDMRMDRELSRSAAEIVNSASEKELANLIYGYGEDRKSRRIARAMVAARPIQTTAQLAEVVQRAIGRHEDIHPATRTFQALRIAVNDELGQLERALPLLIDRMNPGGRIAVISFHSLEDRIVKDFFRIESRDCICPPEQPVCTCDHRASLKLLTKKPVTDQTAFNPRARSAKLRAAEKLTPKPKETR